MYEYSYHKCIVNNWVWILLVKFCDSFQFFYSFTRHSRCQIPPWEIMKQEGNNTIYCAIRFANKNIIGYLFYAKRDGFWPVVGELWCSSGISFLTSSRFIFCLYFLKFFSVLFFPKKWFFTPLELRLKGLPLSKALLRSTGDAKWWYKTIEKRLKKKKAV